MLRTTKCNEIHCGPGVNYYHRGMIDKAIQTYQKILRGPTTRYAIVNSWLAIAYFHKKMLDEAMRVYKAFVDTRPGLSITDYHFETCFLCSELTDEMINLVAQILKKRPDQAFCYYCLGVAWYYKGELDKSIDHLLRATKIDDKTRIYASSLAELQNTRERFYQES